ncbi:MAG TPA: dihydroorotate dehydrogenase-like protein [Phycisphaerae bacterium]|jgi:dihydroorotate dehydrogenase (fumarate)|nr:dihydroorotate dehydrogenase-like protein [Phycisphaerae bacterium]HOB75886.1 dihydroorotate dehydrogenase-like protein [Phycisphaerae bacterium]HOJ54427.1 dihydroorotate dehydrogenase-like protein [Phycisphaerae bacterium]HOL26258.1 dihydroorotate dehydrogenase-like protein [Phycisphaerae bacterium]HPP20782.1 dihydroorotate dehydrogenase-like protein [Phycisphaerae bacterium]
MDLTTTYLGFKLPHPFITGASPLSDTLDRVRRLEDAGTAMIVLRSLFEEQIKSEEVSTFRNMEVPAHSFQEAVTYFPDPKDFVLGPDEYLEHLRQVKKAVSVPVVGSLNGVTVGGWLEYARQIEQAGADALELHVYTLNTDPHLTGDEVVSRTVEMVRTVKEAVKIPVAVKLSPFYTAFANVAAQLDSVGADALVLFNRFYHPDIDVENLELVDKLSLSDSGDLPLRLRWLAILAGQVKADLAVTGGVHTTLDAVKAIMCGATGVQMVSALLKHGPAYLRVVQTGLSEWLEANEYESLDQLRGSMSKDRCPDPSPFNRASYIRVLQTWQNWQQV